MAGGLLFCHAVLDGADVPGPRIFTEEEFYAIITEKAERCSALRGREDMEEMLRTAIVEDEDAAARDLEECLKRYCETRGISCSTERFRDGKTFLEQYSPRYDLIFMDIRMPKVDGMAAAQRLRELDRVTALVFVTSMVQYAVKGYEVEALDFIVKPVRYSSFEMKMRRILQAVDLKKGREVLLNVGGTVRVLTSSSIYYVEVMDHDLTYHTSQGDVTVRGKLSAVEQQLPKEVFFRCSTSYLINLQHVRQLTGDTVLVGDRELRVSRGKKKELMAALAACLGRGV